MHVAHPIGAPGPSMRVAHDRTRRTRGEPGRPRDKEVGGPTAAFAKDGVLE